MKKNKKYWKKEAKALGERCDELEEYLDRYMLQVDYLEQVLKAKSAEKSIIRWLKFDR